MDHFIHKLPMDIVLRILPYTYNPQTKELLEDIRNNYQTKNELFSLYYQLYIVENGDEEPEDKNWLDNDLVAYTNDYNATMYGFVEKHYNIFKRNIFLHGSSIEETKANIDRFVLKLYSKNVTSVINIYLGLLKPHERDEFIRITSTMGVDI